MIPAHLTISFTKSRAQVVDKLSFIKVSFIPL